MKLWIAAALALGAAACAAPQTTSDVTPTPSGQTAVRNGGIPAFEHPPLSAPALMAHVARLASDEFEGRAPSTHGEVLTIDYISRAFAAAGLQPGNHGSWTQDVPMAAAEVTNNPTLTIGSNAYAYATDFVAWTKRQNAPHISLANAPMVFVGYGITAPENHWDDYAGLDVRGKVVVILINDPDFETNDDRGFGGRAMTYYGRWTYKYEEAARHGAAGAIIIHEDAPAAYPWAVVNSSWTGPQYDLVQDDQGAGRVQVEGWVTNAVGRAILQSGGLTYEQAKTRAQRRGFRAVPLRSRMSIALETHIETSMSHNVVGILPGRTRPQETVLYSAHWDHLGHCTPVDGDDICNGALDNATGTSGLIELARNYAANGPADRSVVFLAWTGEESGLLGSAYYASHPIYAPADTVALINMDGLSSAGPTRDITVVGFGQNDMDQRLTTVARAAGVTVTPEAFPERGSFYRSDQFSLAKIGIPSLYTSAGIDMVDGGTARGRALSDDYIAHRYHKPQDEISDSWDMTGATRDLGLFYTVGRQLADGTDWPQWRATSEFRAARERSRPSN